MRLQLHILLAILMLALGCSAIVDNRLKRAGRDDGGPSGETCMNDAQCVAFDPFNCARVCVDGHCQDGPQTPDGTMCGTAMGFHCVAGDCVARACGDGFVDRMAMPPEFCDDGNRVDTDACNNACTRSCAPPAPVVCADANRCNGEEMCMDGLCVVMPTPPGSMCLDGTAPGTCQGGLCVAD